MKRREWNKIAAYGLILSMTMQSIAPAMPVWAAETAVLAEQEAGTVKAVSSELHYLSDLEWESAVANYGKWTKDIDFDSSNPLTLKVDGKTVTFKKGITANASATAVYDVSEFAGQVFFAYAGVNYSQLANAGKGANCDFEIKIDGVSKWKSSKVLGPADNAEQILVDIPEGAKKLSLIIGDGNGSEAYDHGVFGKACILGNREMAKEVELTDFAAPVYLEIGEQGKVSFNVKYFDETAITLDDLDVRCESSDENVLTVEGAADNWKVTGKGNGSAVVKVTVKDKKSGAEFTREKSIMVGENEESTKTVQSPNGEHKIAFTLTPSGELLYRIVTGKEEQKTTMVANAETGLVTNLGDFSAGLSLLDVQMKEVKDSYDIIGGKKDHVDAVGNEMTLKFEKTPNENGVYYYVIARAYDDGVAFRYQISSDKKQKLLIDQEKTAIMLPQGTVSQAMDYHQHHEKVAYEKKNSELTGIYLMPLLFEKNGVYGLISEAALNQEYAGGALFGDGTGRLDIRFATGFTNADRYPTTQVETSTSVQDFWGGEEHPWMSPWRYVVIGDLKTINANTMADTLSPACVLEDTSWIKPGVTGWTWLNGEGTSSFETYKRYVDMAADMGWEYMLLDEGWQPKKAVSGVSAYRGYYPWFDELMAYAKEKNVGIIVWANNIDLDTAEEREVLKEWSEKGVVGIKPDFFNSHSQYMMELYAELYKATAENHLLLNIHGAPTPMGERRTYPHLVTREGIHGAEQILFDNAGVTARHNCTIPFVRNAAGPADFTPMLSTRKHNSPYGGGATYSYEGHYTTGQMSALPIIFESGITCMADTADVYLNSVTRPLYTNLPSGWKNSQVLEADLGNYVTIERESNDGRWYIGTICDAARDTEIALDFLPEGKEYSAYIVEDGNASDVLTLRAEEVTAEDTISLKLKKTGGALIMITEGKVSAVEEISLSEHKLELKRGKTAELTAVTAPADAVINTVVWDSSDPSVVTVREGKLTAVGTGVATVTASCGKVKDTCEVWVYPGTYEVADGWTILNEDVEYWKLNSETSLTVTTQAGGIYMKEKNTANNEFFIDADKDFEVSVKLAFSPTENYQSAGILALGDNQSYAGVWRRYHSSFSGNLVNMISYNGSKLSEAGKKPETSTEHPVWLKLVKDGQTLTSYTSENGTDWTKLYTETNAALDSAGKIRLGVYAGNDDNKGIGVANIPATFEDFTYNAKGEKAAVVPFGEAADAKLMKLEMTEEGKTEYTVGEAFDASGYQLTAYYADRTERAVKGTECEVTGFDPEKEGAQEVTFTYEEKSVTVKVFVVKSVPPTEDITKSFKVVVNGELSGEYAYNEKVTVTAEDKEGFAGWAYNGMIVSEEKTYTFYVMGDMELTAVYEETEQKPAVILSNPLAIKDGTKTGLRFPAQIIVPDGYKLLDAGMVWSAKETPNVLKVGAEGVKQTAVKTVNKQYQFSVTINGVPEGRYVRGVIYAKLLTPNNEEVYYYSAERIGTN